MTAGEVLAWASSASLSACCAAAAANLAVAPRVAPARPERIPSIRVSVLVPVRDEEARLPAVLGAWGRVRHPDWELVFLDDGSRDRSRALLEAFAAGRPGVRILSGTATPPGWRGKNWACHQLAEAADGQVLVFADADVEPAPGALASTLERMEALRADALSAFGSQRGGDLATRAATALVMRLPVVGMLPLRLLPSLPWCCFAMAVGQWFAFRREAYRAVGGHASVAGTVAEDLALARRLKARGLRLVTALAPEALRVSMYDDLRALAPGFAKNIDALGGGGTAGRAVVLGALLWLHVLPLLLPLAGAGLPGFVPAALLLLLRLLDAATWRGGWKEILVHPLGAAVLLGVLARSALQPLRPLAWKGRTL